MDVEEDDVEEEDRSQDREAHFVRACVGDMRMDISQEPILCGNLQGKCRTRRPGTSIPPRMNTGP